MAGYFDDFRDATLGNPHPDIIPIWLDLDQTVISSNPLPDSDRSVLFQWGLGAFNRAAARYKSVQTEGRTTVRLLVTQKQSGGEVGHIAGPFLSGSGDSSTRSGYVVWSGTNFRLSKYENGGDTAVAESTQGGSGDILTRYLEIIRDGSLVEVRSWLYGDARPASPEIAYTDPSPLSLVGYVGVSLITTTDVIEDFELHSIAVGTNGDPAPTEPVSTGVTGTADHQASTATHTATGSVSSTITGTADHQAATATQAATGTREVTATGNHQAQAAAHSASGSVGSAITGTASHEAATATHSATGEREITGTSNSQAARATQSATGLRVVTGDAANQASTATHSAQGAIGNAISGSADHQAQASTNAATGTREVTGTSTGQAQTATHNAMAVREIIGNGTQAANDATQTSTGTISKTITGTASHQAQRATHQASSRPVLLRPIKNTSLVEVTPAYSAVDISTTYTIAVQ